MTRFWGGIAAIMVGLALAFPAQAQNAPYFRGKTISLIYGGGIGGGYDTYARMLQPHYAKHIPGNPRIIVKGVPGAGTLVAANYLYEIAQGDGSEIGTVGSGTATAELLETPNIRFDPRKFVWLGSMTSDVSVALSWHTSGIATIQDTFERKMIVGGGGPTSGNVIFPLLLNRLLGTKFDIITGYKSSGEAMLAVERGEVEGRCTTLNSLRTAQPHWLTDKLIRVLVVVSSVDDPEFASVPRAKDLLKSDAERKAFDFFQAPDEIQNPYMLPPGTPPEILAIYRKAFDSVVKDPAYLAEAIKRKQNVVPQTGDFVQKTIAAMYETPPEVIERVKQATSVTGRIGTKN